MYLWEKERGQGPGQRAERREKRGNYILDVLYEKITNKKENWKQKDLMNILFNVAKTIIPDVWYIEKETISFRSYIWKFCLLLVMVFEK